jgi:hypothetical protein
MGEVFADPEENGHRLMAIYRMCEERKWPY